MIWLALALSCKEKPAEDSDAEVLDVADLACPGDASCANNDGPLRMGIARVSVIPDCYESWTDGNDNAVWNDEEEVFHDCGCDRLCAEDDGYPGPDEGEGDGVFQAAWLAGFQHARPATVVRDASVGLRGEGDGLWAYATYLEQGETSLALVSIDSIGIMIDQTAEIRAAVASAVDVDYVLVQATHDHESPDMMGIWGPSTTVTGFNADYSAQIAAAVATAVADAAASAVEVRMRAGAVDAGTYHERGTANLITDTRDPWIVDPAVQAIHFADSSGATVGTLVNWANHPETVADENTLFTSDYAHALRETVSDGVVWQAFEKQGLGGETMLMNGAVGGMMTSLRGVVEDPDGGQWQSASFEKADVVGQLVGGMVLDAVADGEDVADPKLRFSTRTLRLPVANYGFQAMFLLGVLGHRQTYDYDPEQPLGDDNTPYIHTELALVDLGPVRMLTVPGEMLPELAVGGYDGSYTPPTETIVGTDNENPPDLTTAPAGPYLKDEMGAPYNWILGLGNDELGYIIPPYNFGLNDAAPYILEDFGDHYEETNSLGPDTAPLVIEEARLLLGFQTRE